MPFLRTAAAEPTVRDASRHAERAVGEVHGVQALKDAHKRQLGQLQPVPCCRRHGKQAGMQQQQARRGWLMQARGGWLPHCCWFDGWCDDRKVRERFGLVGL